MNFRAIRFSCLIAILAGANTGRAATLQISLNAVDPFNPGGGAAHSAALINAWNAYAALDGANDGVATVNGGGTGMVGIETTTANLETYPTGIFQAAAVGPGGGPGQVTVNATAIAQNFGGRKGSLRLTDVNIDSGVPYLSLHITFLATYSVDAEWLRTLALSQPVLFGWQSGFGADARFHELGQVVAVAMNGTITPEATPPTIIPTINLLGNGPLTGGGFPSLVPPSDPDAAPGGSIDLGFSSSSFPISSGPWATIPGAGDPDATFDVRYDLDLTLYGGAPAANEVSVFADNSFDGAAVGNGFGVPEPSGALLILAGLGGLAARRRRA